MCIWATLHMPLGPVQAQFCVPFNNEYYGACSTLYLGVSDQSKVMMEISRLRVIWWPVVQQLVSSKTK